MNTINKFTFAEQEVKKSKFIAYIVPFFEFDEFCELLRNDHPKAAHIVWAYRHLNAYQQVVENSSDDGEPKGSSAPPVLDALRGANLINTAVLVVRYFGGTKLGIGGLVRAYSSSANLAINEAVKNGDLVKFEIRDIFKVAVNFSLLGRFDHFFLTRQLKATKEFDEHGALFSLLLTQSELTSVSEFLATLNGGFRLLALPLFAKNLGHL